MPKFNKEKLLQQAREINKESIFSTDILTSDQIGNALADKITTPYFKSHEGMQNRFEAQGDLIDKPFHEFSRTSGQHFYMYLLTDDDKDRLTMDELKGIVNLDIEKNPAMVERLNKKWEKFVAIVTETDEKKQSKAIVDMYDRFLLRTSEKLESAYKKLGCGLTVSAMEDLALLGDFKSVTEQTLQLGNKEGMSDYQKKITEQILESNKKNGKGWSLNSVSLLEQALHPLFQNYITYKSAPNDETKKEFYQYALEYVPSMAKEIDIDKMKQASESKLQSLSEKTVAINAQMSEDDLEGKVPNVDSDLGNLLVLLKNNRRGLNGGSPKYRNIKKALNDYCQTHDRDKLNLVLRNCDIYLNDRTPSSDHGQERYILIACVKEMAKKEKVRDDLKQICQMDLEDEATGEKMREFSQSLKERTLNNKLDKEATFYNYKVVAEENIKAGKECGARCIELKKQLLQIDPSLREKDLNQCVKSIMMENKKDYQLFSKMDIMANVVNTIVDNAGTYNSVATNQFFNDMNNKAIKDKTTEEELTLSKFVYYGEEVDLGQYLEKKLGKENPSYQKILDFANKIKEENGVVIKKENQKENLEEDLEEDQKVGNGKAININELEAEVANEKSQKVNGRKTVGTKSKDNSKDKSENDLHRSKTMG